MLKESSYSSFIQAKGPRIAVYREIPGDTLTPQLAFYALRRLGKEPAVFEVNPKDQTKPRYTYLYLDPIATIKAHGNTIHIDEDGVHNTIIEDPFTLLRQYQTKYHFEAQDVDYSVGGSFGFMSYDSVRLIETLLDKQENHHQIPDLLFRFYRKQIIFDHQHGKVLLLTVVTQTQDLSAQHRAAQLELDELEHVLRSSSTSLSTLPAVNDERSIKTSMSDSEFCELVAVAKEHIVQGDVFQIVLSREFSLSYTGDPFAVYRALKLTNPAPYLFYFAMDDYVILGASPEKLVSLNHGLIESCPLAGTRLRGVSNDEEISRGLLSDEKEIAEHMMLVDLARNDLGKIAESGTVSVTKLKAIEKYARVMHIASTVQATLRNGLDVFDVLNATFPAGTLSGAPKIRAMEIIDTLEPQRRGIYGGAICAIDNAGNLESCIAIRTVFIKDNQAFVRAGAGIVMDSDPQKEADETRHKASAVLDGILLALRFTS